MADTKGTALTALTAPTKDDLLLAIDDPAGTPASRKLAISALLQNGLYVLPALELTCPTTDFALSNATGVQSLFTSADDAFTVAANTTYRLEGLLFLGTGATTHTTALAFALATAVASSFVYSVLAWSQAANATVTAQNTTLVATNASTVVTATSTAVQTALRIQGLLRFTTGGTMTPQVNFSAAPGAGANFTKVGSYLALYPLGADTFAGTSAWG